jgi:hypothetical protein
MTYKGKKNRQCPVCNSKNVRTSHPVMFRVDGLNHSGQMWCDNCFQPLYSIYSSLRHERDMPKHQEQINRIARIANKNLSSDTDLEGFWYGIYEDGKLGLVINYSTQ